MGCDKAVSILAALAGLIAAAAALAGEPDLRLAPVGAIETVFRWRGDACGPDHIPDAPARAYRDAGGLVHLFATNQVNRAWVGPELDRVRPDCRVVHTGGHDDDPAAFDDRHWIATPYTLDGTTVFALVHNEFQGHRRPALCPAGTYMACWNNAVTFAVSRDGGRSFTQPGPAHRLVATLPYRYDGSLGRHVGYFNPSNIVALAGAYHTLVFATRVEAQQPGACLLRSERLDQPRAWRAWDGTGFGVGFADPYREMVRSPAAHVCTPVGKGVLTAPVSSLVRHAASGVFVALMARDDGIYATTSRDLIAWTAARLVLPLVVAGKQKCGDTAAFAYPSLLDPRSPTRNFETVGAEAWLYLTRFNLGPDCGLRQDRDLVRIRVRLG